MYDFFTNSPHPIIIISKHSKEWSIKDVNSSFQSFTGYNKEDLVHHTISILSYSTPLLAVLTRLAVSDRYYDHEMESEISTKFGQCLPVLLQLTRIDSEDNSLYALILRDITEKKWIEQILLSRRIEASLLLSPEGLIKSINRYYSPVRFNTSEFQEGSAADFILNKDKLKVYRFFETLNQTRAEAELSITLTLLGHEFRSTVLVKPFFLANGQLKGYAVVFTKLDLIDPYEDSSHKLRLLMIQKKISVTSLAETTQISLTTISKIRNGKIKKPQRLTADLIARELGVAAGEIWSCFR